MAFQDMLFDRSPEPNRDEPLARDGMWTGVVRELHLRATDAGGKHLERPDFDVMVDGGKLGVEIAPTLDKSSRW